MIAAEIAVVIVAFCAVILVFCLVLPLVFPGVLGVGIAVAIVLPLWLLIPVLVVLGLFPAPPIRVAILMVLAVVPISATIVFFAVVMVPLSLAVFFVSSVCAWGIMGVIELVRMHSPIGSIAKADAEIRKDAGLLAFFRLFAISPVLHGQDIV